MHFRLSFLAQCVLAAGLGGVIACSPVFEGVDPSTGARVRLETGDAAPNTQFSGQWDSPQLGQLSLREDAPDSFSGSYRVQRQDPPCPVVGRLLGTRSGNLLRVSWNENYSACGRAVPVRGRGYFFYRTGTVTELLGNFGYWDDEEHGGPWLATKQGTR